MKRFPSIKKNEEFKNIYKRGRSLANKFLVMYVIQNTGAETRIGISASKKVGNSIVRHRMTRILRECFRLHLPEIKDGCDIVVVVRAFAAGEGYASMSEAYMDLVRKAGIAR